MQWYRTGRRKDGLKKDPASSDAQLAERLKQRDENAFLSLYDLHRSSVFRFLMHMTGSITARRGAYTGSICRDSRCNVRRNCRTVRSTEKGLGRATCLELRATLQGRATQGQSSSFVGLHSGNPGMESASKEVLRERLTLVMLRHCWSMRSELKALHCAIHRIAGALSGGVSAVQPAREELPRCSRNSAMFRRDGCLADESRQGHSGSQSCASPHQIDRMCN